LREGKQKGAVLTEPILEIALRGRERSKSPPDANVQVQTSVGGRGKLGKKQGKKKGAPLWLG